MDEKYLMTEELEARIAMLEGEVARLRAREAITATFNQYLYSMDTAFSDGILDAYAEDAVLDVLNFPPDGVDMHFEGREAMRKLYDPYGARESLISGGHTSSNIAIAVSDDALTASLTSYFTTTGNRGVQGGRYEGTLRLDPDGKWRWVTLAIISAWGFRPNDSSLVSDAVAIERSAFGGRPATAD
jgi:ketosteroid isomerase-like protein